MWSSKWSEKNRSVPSSGLLAAKISEREGSRIGVMLFGEVRVFHRPHPSPDTDKGAAESIRKWLNENGVQP